MMQTLKSLFSLGIVLLMACSLGGQDISEAKARELAGKAFQEYLLQKKINQNQYKDPRITYNAADGLWAVYYEWIGSPNTDHGIHILIDRFGRVEVHAAQP